MFDIFWFARKIKKRINLFFSFEKISTRQWLRPVKIFSMWLSSETGGNMILKLTQFKSV